MVSQLLAHKFWTMPSEDGGCDVTRGTILANSRGHCALLYTAIVQAKIIFTPPFSVVLQVKGCLGMVSDGYRWLTMVKNGYIIVPVGDDSSQKP